MLVKLSPKNPKNIKNNELRVPLANYILLFPSRDCIDLIGMATIILDRW